MKTVREQIEHIDLILKYTDLFVHEDYKENEINKLLDERLILMGVERARERGGLQTRCC